ncbi:MAG: ABC transporter ATP-binding protein [Gammaproteobacteria bacterium]|nr:ABC transporter ATP-binding protein [Gammaproteobacteria bacterium]
MTAAAQPFPGILLDVSHISKTFLSGGRKLQALSEVSFKLSAGRVTGLIGPDAAGKTTLMRLIAGLLLPDSGSITVLGMDATRDSLAVQSNIGYMPQHFGLYEDLSVQENLDLYADLQGVPREQRAARYRELMSMTGLTPFTRRLAGRLSGGMKQKLGLACTLVRPPRLLLLDEPTVGVDPVSRRELWAIIYRLVRDQGMSVLLSTAYLDEAERCHQVLLLYAGRLLGEGPPADFASALNGRTFSVQAPGMNKRLLQQRLRRAPGVLDAVIQGESVRIVMHQPLAPEAAALLPGSGLTRISPIAPRFEDSFITRIQALQPEKTPMDFLQPPRTGGTATAGVVIEVENLSRRFGDFYAVRNLSFSVGAGEVFGLLGANGAGKTTTFRMLCGLLPPSGGSLRVAGVDLRLAAAQARARIGYMSQKFSLYEALTVKQNLDFFASAYGLTGKPHGQRVAWALEQFELSSYAGDNASSLPLGFKQRLQLAAALMHDPRILFLDEPTSGVDPLARREFWARISAMSEQGITVLVTTHFMEEVEYCDRLVIMASGELLKLGTPEDIKAAAASREHPQPSMEDAFIALIEAHEQMRMAS